MDTSSAWATCNSCKGDIDFDQVHYVCSVSTCNRKGTDFHFCSVECWDVHVPAMRHRDAWAEEKRSPTRAQWERDRPADDDETPRPARSPGSGAQANSRSSSVFRDDDLPPLNEDGLPYDVLIVVSKLKSYVRARSGMNTSDSVMEVLSERLRQICDEGIRNASRDGRRTLMDRDLR